MGSLGEKIISMRESFQTSYVKPSPDLNDKYRESLATSNFALDYLHITRGLTAETVSNFNLGYDLERNAITIPIYKRGELINIRYRHLDENAKAKYTQEKGCEVWLFNEDGITRGQTKGGLLIVEGEFDCMSAWQAGFKNVISPASGKDSYGVWIELLDSIPKIYVCYDNDKPGKSAAIGLAERVGTDKSFEVIYPLGIKDANDYFKIHTAEEYKELIRSARPFYKYQYSGVKDVIDAIREKRDEFITLDCLPRIMEFEEGWTVVMSGMSGIGKTSVAMNIANELGGRDIPCLIFPIERGIKAVGKRLLQVRYNKTKEELRNTYDSEWEKIIPDVLDLPIYFSMPNGDSLKETVIKAKRLFNTKFVIIDHLSLFVRNQDPKSINAETTRTIQEFVRIGQETGCIMIVIHHIKKDETVGTVKKKPRMQDLKGSSELYQDPEAVIMLSEPSSGQIEIDIVKNKGDHGSRIYEFNTATGKIGKDISEDHTALSPKTVTQRNFDQF